MAKKVTIELNERQARIVLVAVEEWFRLRMGQTRDLEDGLAFWGYNHEEASSVEFDRRILRRNAISEVLKAAMRIAFPDYGYPTKNEDEVHIASDIWSQLRYELSPKVEWGYNPFQMGVEPMPKITVREE